MDNKKSPVPTFCLKLVSKLTIAVLANRNKNNKDKHLLLLYLLTKRINGNIDIMLDQKIITKGDLPNRLAK